MQYFRVNTKQIDLCLTQDDSCVTFNPVIYHILTYNYLILFVAIKHFLSKSNNLCWPTIPLTSALYYPLVKGSKINVSPSKQINLKFILDDICVTFDNCNHYTRGVFCLFLFCLFLFVVLFLFCFVLFCFVFCFVLFCFVFSDTIWLLYDEALANKHTLNWDSEKIRTIRRIEPLASRCPMLQSGTIWLFSTNWPAIDPCGTGQSFAFHSC